MIRKKKPQLFAARNKHYLKSFRLTTLDFHLVEKFTWLFVANGYLSGILFDF